MRLLAVVVGLGLVVCAGCGPSAEVVAFQKAVVHFVELGRSAIKFVEVSSSPENFSEKVKEVDTAFSKIPDPPFGQKYRDAIELAESARLAFNTAIDYHKLGDKNGFERCLKNTRQTLDSTEKFVTKF